MEIEQDPSGGGDESMKEEKKDLVSKLFNFFGTINHNLGVRASALSLSDTAADDRLLVHN